MGVRVRCPIKVGFIKARRLGSRSSLPSSYKVTFSTSSDEGLQSLIALLVLNVNVYVYSYRTAWWEWGR